MNNLPLASALFNLDIRTIDDCPDNLLRQYGDKADWGTVQELLDGMWMGADSMKAPLNDVDPSM